MQIVTKQALRKKIKASLQVLSKEYKETQSARITKKVLASDVFQKAQKISIYLSTEDEVNTIHILKEMFHQNKQVFVPTYQGNIMEMVQLNSMADFEKLPVTKWNIKQPLLLEERKNLLATGGLDIFFVPGVAFTMIGGRLGHGKGYYDSYFRRYFDMYPEKFIEKFNEKTFIDTDKTLLIGLAFKEQIVNQDILPLEAHDYLLNTIITS